MIFSLFEVSYTNKNDWWISIGSFEGVWNHFHLFYLDCNRRFDILGLRTIYYIIMEKIFWR